MRRRPFIQTAAVVLCIVVVLVFHDVCFPHSEPWQFTYPWSNQAPFSLFRQYGNDAPNVHPILTLIAETEDSWHKTRERQSKTLKEAVREYRRRYQMPPPPNFDRWYEFAKSYGTPLIDEFDSIHDMLTPFWGVDPSIIRARTVETLGYVDQNQLWGLQIRNGSVSYTEDGILPRMIEGFVKWLPDMDLAFNGRDEPRVVLPNGDLEQLVERALNKAMPRAKAIRRPINSFTNMTDRLKDKFEKSYRTRFFQTDKVPLWQASKISCGVDTAVGNVSGQGVDDVSSYSVGPLNFVRNATAASDICNSPSLQSSHGYFVKANPVKISHDLVPVFSPSKISSYADILIPEPYYYVHSGYKEEDDTNWSEKNDTIYWRGSTTGGYSTNGEWKHQHRQRMVRALNFTIDGEGVILERKQIGAGAGWRAKTVSRSNYIGLSDVGFTDMIQCDHMDCEKQRQEYSIKAWEARSTAFKHRHLLDIDGNAFSGRFYEFLRSKSLVYKVGIFREWHQDWLWPWVHYIPLSFRFDDGDSGGSDWLETIRFFTSDPVGRKEAKRLTALKREWAVDTLGKKQMEVWLFRLLLEYGRLIDDNRQSIGFWL
ncbi:hypothetical protein F5Y18DRAFT_423145 [Xylariaceae sp. FL1019]|nr:hypothetical protein F5Y18DRAFT_423145 [Xylariaceae sp. FL1019]